MTDPTIVPGATYGADLKALFINCTAYGNQRSEWDAGCRFDYANPDYR